jgi:hypothetical protein
MTALAVDLVCWAVAAVVTGRGALWRLSVFPLLLLMESSAAAKEIPAQFIISFRSG